MCFCLIYCALDLTGLVGKRLARVCRHIHKQSKVIYSSTQSRSTTTAMFFCKRPAVCSLTSRGPEFKHRHYIKEVYGDDFKSDDKS